MPLPVDDDPQRRLARLPTVLKLTGLGRSTIYTSNDDRLQHAALTDVIGKFVKRRIGEFGARIVGVFVEAFDGNKQGLAGGPGLGVEQVRLNIRSDAASV